MFGVIMSDGKKFVKIDPNLTPEQRLDELERKYSVIQERIQAYNQVLVEFANIRSDLNSNKKQISSLEKELEDWILRLKQIISEIISTVGQQSKNNGLVVSTLEEQKKAHQKLSDYIQERIGQLYRDSESFKFKVNNVESEHTNTRELSTNLDRNFTAFNKAFQQQMGKINEEAFENSAFKTFTRDALGALKIEIQQLLSSFQEMPQFNEWSTKIYIKVCNDINDKQKQFYYELDKRSQQLKEQLASDPYTAESVKKILKGEMDALAMDGRNAYLKATNAAQQIQLLEKKVENINLILKKYELSK